MTFHYTQPFIVVGAFIVRDDKLLLIQENHHPDKGKWNLPAGKLDFGESPVDAARREAFEEAGIDFMPSALLGIHSVHRSDLPAEIHVLRIIFIGETKNDVSLEHGDAVDGITEIADYKWLTLEEVLAMNDNILRYHDIKKSVRDFQAGKQYPLEVVAHIIQTP